MQRGFALAGRHGKSGLCIMDESSILRRRGLQVGKRLSPCLCGAGGVGGFVLEGDFVLCACVICVAPVLLFRQNAGLWDLFVSALGSTWWATFWLCSS